MKYVMKPVLARRKQNVTGSLSFGWQIGFWFTVFNTTLSNFFDFGIFFFDRVPYSMKTPALEVTQIVI